MQWVTLASAVVGAVIATASAALLDRSRWKRDQHDQLVGVRRMLYGDYIKSLSQARNTFRSLARNVSAEAPDRQRLARDSFAPCYDMRYQMSITASKEVFEASEVAFRRLRDMRDLAAAGTVPSDDAYAEGRMAYEEALGRLRSAMRQDLGADRASLAD
ncbi:hypothetical protein ACFW5G_06120 [Streptomyces griseoaurantiacus]|uniref:hypothetical protein n=1 Tax=Streptomyces griseoaurantiacus TaxID=68213 RepID=UPI003684D1AF